MMPELNSPSQLRPFIWLRANRTKFKTYALVCRKIIDFSRNYCADFGIIQKASSSCQSDCLSSLGVCARNGLDVRRKSGG